MQRFFVSPGDIKDNKVTIGGSDGVHISRALRMAKGDRILICDGAGVEYECVISGFGGAKGTEVELEIMSEQKNKTEPPLDISLFQGLPKSDKMDGIVQKSVELGVSRIIPFISDHTVSRPDSASFEKKLERWNRIAYEAAVQCGRGIIPRVESPVSFDESLSRCRAETISFFCYEGGGQPLPRLLEAAPSKGSLGFLIGPEGGFSEKEAEAAKAAGIAAADLGARILRTETASLCVLSCISFVYELGGPRPE
jgi:16S rRNA (uracil1498-N3)-methyltransferase